MFKRILVPLDGSELAERALEPALKLAGQAEGEVLLLRAPVAETMLVPGPDALGGYGVLWPDQALERSRREARDYLKIVQQVRTRPEFTLRARMIEGDAATVIVETASEDLVDLIVMSTHGYSGITRWMLGSVTEKVLRSAPCPVMVVRLTASLRRILIPLDGSDLSELALAPGLEIAEQLGSEVTLLRAVKEVSLEEIERLEEIESGLGWRMEKEILEEPKSYLRSLVPSHPRAGPEIKTAVTYGPAAESILTYAESNAMDLIVMSTHGRTGLKRWVYGSVTEKVLRSGCCSMLIVRPSFT